MKQAEHKTVDVWGLNVRYVEAGGQEGNGPVVLLLHGLATSLLTWYCNIDALADAGYRVIAPDLPGYGDSDKPGHLDYSPDSAAEFVYDFSQELGLESFSLVGSSAGGLIAGLFALEHPKMVEKMALVGSGGFGREVSWYLRTISIPLLGDLFYQPWLHKIMGATNHLFYRPPAILTELLPEMDRFKQLPGARTAMLRSVRSSINVAGLRKEWYILERLKDSTVPLITIWGAEDIIIPASHASNVRRELPESIVQVIPECGHWPQMEKPGEFNSMLISFLDGGPAQTAHQES
ncbi:MAG: alpha/beta fold hydrolase [Chloroflexi bacterium]|nr:alpha/beta fold hydrolase [Chloroflexota bacterium]